MRLLKEDFISVLILEEDEDFLEPAEKFAYYNVEYPCWSTFTASARPEDYEKGKFNRYAKIGEMAADLEKDFQARIQADPSSLEARCSYACLMMMRYGIRVGNEGSAEGYVSGLKKNKGEVVQTFGMTTLQNKHIMFGSKTMLLDFLGKEQVKHKIKIREPYLVEIGKYYYDKQLPDNKWIGIEYEQLFDFVHAAVGKNFVPKDFRTFCANTVGWRVMLRFLEQPKREKKSDANKEIAAIVWCVARKLGNTPGIAKKNYLDHRMIDWFKAQRVKQETDK
jgi:DNA topoisomerase IB